jgi:hypothetical protein
MDWKNRITVAACSLAATFGITACGVKPNKDLTAIVDAKTGQAAIYNKGELIQVMFNGKEKNGVIEGKAYRPDTDSVFEGAERGPYDTIHIGQQLRCNVKARNCEVYDGAHSAAPYLITGNVTFGKVDLSTLPFVKEMKWREENLTMTNRALRGEELPPVVMAPSKQEEPVIRPGAPRP